MQPHKLIIFIYILLLSYSGILNAQSNNMKKKNVINENELVYLEAYVTEAMVGKSDFSLSLAFSNQEKVKAFNEIAESYLAQENPVFGDDEMMTYQSITLGPEFSEILYQRANQHIKKLQTSKQRIQQIISDSNFSAGSTLLANVQHASKGRVLPLTRELNEQAFFALLWLMVVDEHYSKQVEKLYDWLKSSDPKVKQRNHGINLAKQLNNAIQDNDLPRIKVLLDEGLDLSQVGFPIEEFPLKTAAQNASVEILEYLLEVSPVMQIATQEGWIKSIRLAIEQQRQNEANILINALAKSTWPAEEIWPPLIISAWKTDDPAQFKSLFDPAIIASLSSKALYQVIDKLTLRFSPYSKKHVPLNESKQHVLTILFKTVPNYNDEFKGRPALLALTGENYQLLDLFLRYQQGVLQSKPDFIAAQATLAQIAAYNEDVTALKLLQKHGASLATTSEYNDDSLTILGGRILYSNMDLTPQKQAVIDYLVTLNTPVLMVNDEDKLESLIMNYAKHRKITVEESAAFLKGK